MLVLHLVPTFVQPNEHYMEKYNQLRKQFENDIKKLFPLSTNLDISITIDQVNVEELKSLNQPLEKRNLFGAMDYIVANVSNDEFQSEIL